MAKYKVERARLGHMATAHLEDYLRESVPEHEQPIVRQYTAAEINILEGAIGRGEKNLKDLEAGCTGDGPLSMRAERSGTIYTVTVCTSENIPDEPGEPATIIRA